MSIMEKTILFTHSPITAPPLTLTSREIGACVEFQGIVREKENDRPLAGLHYEAYEPMAASELHRIFDRLHAVHPCDAVQFIHRLGWVPVGEASLFIRVLASHRGEALRFLAEAIDRMKQDVPIWKHSEP
jgi:molybdopterin synthase catalytic subunit